MSQNQAAPIKLRRFAKPKLLQRRKEQLNDLEMLAIPNPTNQKDQNPTTSSPPLTTLQKNPSHPSIAENFKNIYSDSSYPASYSGDIHEIANQIPSYRYDFAQQYQTTKLTSSFI